MRSISITLALFAALLLSVAVAAPVGRAAPLQQRAAPTATGRAAEGPPGESVLASAFVREQGRRGLDLLYDMKFDKAERVFARIDGRYPDHPVGPFLEALSTWWKILLDLTDESHDERFYDQMDEVIERSEEMLDEDPDDQDATFFKAAALGFRGRLRSNRRQWLRSAYDAKRAMDYTFALAESNPESADFAFGKAIYDYYAALLPERYPVAKPFMGLFPAGSKQRGLNALRRTANDGWFIQTEANYFLLQIQYRYEQNFRNSLRRVRWLRTEHPNNPFFHNFEGRVYAKWGRWRKAQEIFDAVLARHYAGRTGYNDHMAEIALYYLGRSHLVYDEYRQALRYFVDLERLTAGEEGGAETFYRTLGRLRQGMVYDALGERAAARQRYRSVRRMEDHAGAHERAEKFLEEAYDG
jgi:tetratricopeptide (TPR) repeat protein